jgi:prophage antirepressor-like protein
MNNLKIFNSEEFGNIRTVTIDNEIWFVGKDVAEILSYTNTRDALAKRVDEEDKRDGVAICDPIGREQKPVLINESGLYSLILSSKMPNARKFKRWVTSEVLPAIRKTGHYEMENYSPEMQAILMHDKKLVKMDERVTTLENTMTLDYSQQQALGEAVNYVVIDALGGKESDAYKEIGKKVFSECNRDLKRYFHVNARNNVPKKRFEDAIEYVQHWQPCTNTQIAIKECNSQLRFA